MKISPGLLKQNIFFQKSKCFAKIVNKLSVTHVFIKQIIRAVEVAPPFPLPPHGSAWGGVVVALFSHKPWLWLWV
jgi:hypothetical protein